MRLPATADSPRAWLRRARRVVLALLLLGPLGLPGGSRAEEPYSFAVVPQFEPRKLFSIWRPIVDEVERRAGLALRLEATLGVPEFETAFAAGRFDFVYTNPYQVFLERRRQGYLPLVRDDVPLHSSRGTSRRPPIAARRSRPGAGSSRSPSRPRCSSSGSAGSSTSGPASPRPRPRPSQGRAKLLSAP